MKKILKAIVCFLLIATTILTLSGCKDKEDCIPETLGVAEGLYLYYDNYRSLTDGTQTERLLNDITVDDVTYAVDEYYINQIEYMTNKKEIFYCLETNKEGEDKKFFLWHYNYDTKESGHISTFYSSLHISISERYMFAKTEGVLFDGDLNLVEDELSKYSLIGDFLYAKGNDKFYWWKNGNFYSVNINWATYRKDWVFNGKYAYLFATNYVCAVDLDTGEYKINNFGGEQKFLDATTDYGGAIRVGDNTYFLTYKNIETTNLEYFPLSTGCSLWVANGLDAHCEYTFSEKYDINFTNHHNEDYINLETRYIPKFLNRQKKAKRVFAYYDVQNDKVVFGANKNIEVKKETFVIGEYEFYTDKVHYGALMGSNYCYYLHRITNGKDEILQYHFTNDKNDELLNPVLFDDIYTK